MANGEDNVDVAEDQEDAESQSFYQEMFEKYVQPVIAAGTAKMEDKTVEVSEKASGVGKELSGPYQEYVTESLEGFTAYAKFTLASKEKPDVSDEDALKQVFEWVSRTINTGRKQNARQKLINDAIPPEDKLAASIVKKLIKAGKATDEEFAAKLQEVKEKLFS